MIRSVADSMIQSLVIDIPDHGFGHGSGHLDLPKHVNTDS